MKSKYRKYKKGGPVKPKKRKSASDTLNLDLIDYTNPYGVDTLSTVNIAPRKIYNGEAVDPIFEEDPDQRDMNPKVAALYNTPGALAKYQDRFMDRMLRAAVPTDTTYYDPNLGATVSAGIYDPGQSNGDYSYFKISTDDPSDISSTSKKPIRPKERMLELPPKLPFPNIDLNKLPALRRVLPEIYSRKLNQQKGEYIYDTSEGQVRKRIGQEDADYVRMNRAAIDRMRQKLR